MGVSIEEARLEGTFVGYVLILARKREVELGLQDLSFYFFHMSKGLESLEGRVEGWGC